MKERQERQRYGNLEHSLERDSFTRPGREWVIYVPQ